MENVFKSSQSKVDIAAQLAQALLGIEKEMERTSSSILLVETEISELIVSRNELSHQTEQVQRTSEVDFAAQETERRWCFLCD